MEQQEAAELLTLAEAAANFFMVIYYQAETGKATENDFLEAKAGIRNAIRSDNMHSNDLRTR